MKHTPGLARDLLEAAKKALEEMPYTEVYDRLASAIAKAEEETKGEC